MSSQPRRVSVVVPTRDRPALLQEALASIRALERPEVAFEILVGDNGDLDETAAVAAAFGAIHLRTPVNGAGAARNVALRAASGEFIAFLDDDDLWTPQHIFGHLALLDARPELDAVLGQVINTDHERTPTYGPWPPELPAGRELVVKMLSGYFPQIGATVVRARVREAVGAFDERLLGDQDWDWHLRVARRCQVGFVATPCVLFRQRPPGAFDELQLRRLPFTRRVFFRHALPARGYWSSPAAFVRSYYAALATFFHYFEEAAVRRAEAGERRAALGAIWRACGIIPTRAARMLLTESRLRAALVKALGARPPMAG